MIFLTLQSIDSAPRLGLVVGATNLPALKTVRGAAPEAWILCPGVGAQGGQAMDVCNIGAKSSSWF